jgi:hypothetical protein
MLKETPQLRKHLYTFHKYIQGVYKRTYRVSQKYGIGGLFLLYLFINFITKCL